LSKFIRQNPDSIPNAHGSSRIYGNRVAVGEPLHLQGDPAFRNELEASLAAITQARLLETEAQCEQLIQAAQAQSEEISEKAAQEATALIAQAQSEETELRESAHEQGFKEGFEEGYADGRKAAENEAITILESAQTLVQGAYLAEQRVLKEFEPQALALIAHVLKRILGEHFTENPEAWLALLECGLDSLYLSSKVKLVLSAQLLHEIKAYSAKSEAALATLSRFELVPDALLSAQQLYVVGQEGCFDLSPNNQAKQLLNPLENHLSLPRPASALEGLLSDALLEEISTALTLESDTEASDEELNEPLYISEQAQLLSESEEVVSVAITDDEFEGLR
jgi:flagellar assembly protein FliH